MNIYCSIGGEKWLDSGSIWSELELLKDGMCGERLKEDSKALSLINRIQ